MLVQPFPLPDSRFPRVFSKSVDNFRALWRKNFSTAEHAEFAEIFIVFLSALGDLRSEGLTLRKPCPIPILRLTSTPIMARIIFTKKVSNLEQPKKRGCYGQ
jgi:hypothetical protein